MEGLQDMRIEIPRRHLRFELGQEVAELSRLFRCAGASFSLQRVDAFLNFRARGHVVSLHMSW